MNAKLKFLFSGILAASLAMILSIGCSTPRTSGPTPDSSVEFAKAMTIGWNLGNTLDADKQATKENIGLSTETSWGKPKTTKSMIDAVAAKGFKTIRIPVSWHTHITDSNYTIDPAWMTRVKEVVDYAYNNGMYVILNVHHDDFSDSNMPNTYGYSISTDSGIQNTSKAYLKAVWRQIATTFKDYDNHLVFELLNEPRAIGTDYEWWEDNPQTNVGRLGPVIKDYEQECLNVIRSTDGKNATRFLMVPTYAANSDMATGWSMPEDTATDRLILSTHAYTPSEFALEGNITSYSESVYDTPIEQLITNKFNSLYDTYVKNGIGVVIGEAGCSNKNNEADRKKWITHYFSTAKNKGIPVVLWDNMTANDRPDNKPDTAEGNGEFHDWFNRYNNTWYHESLVNEMIRCSK